MAQADARGGLATAGAPPRSRRRRLPALRRFAAGVPFVLPAFVFLGYFVYYPAWTALAGSFTDWDGFNAARWVGTANFERAFSDPMLRTAAWNNVLWAVGRVFLAIVPPFFAAVLIFSIRGTRWQYLYRMLFVVPIVVPAIVTILIWTFFYRSDGLVNQFLEGVGLGALTHTWLTDPQTALAALVFMGFPWIVPFNLLIFYSGLQAIPREIREAAALDGATGLRRVLRIDVPLVAAQTNLLVALAVISSVQAILEPLIMTGGGPGNSTLTPILYLYRSGVNYGEFGYSMAISVVLFVVVLLLSLFSNRLFRPRTPR